MSNILSGSRKRKRFKEFAHVDDVAPIDIEPFDLDTIRMEVNKHRRSVHLKGNVKDNSYLLNFPF